jgi:hypothetical protein
MTNPEEAGAQAVELPHELLAEARDHLGAAARSVDGFIEEGEKILVQFKL